MDAGDRQKSGDEEPRDDSLQELTDSDQSSEGQPRTEPPTLSRQSSSKQSTTSRQPQTASESVWKRFWRAEDGPLLFLREFLLSASIVLVVGLLLFGLSGVWPPMVAIESESMEPNINKYDLVFVTEPGRFAAAEANHQGIVAAETAPDHGYESFNEPGSVIVFTNPDSTGPPIIHRAHFEVEAGENWHDRADPNHINAESCDELSNCPAPHAGYITKGDNVNSNQRYDQANGIAPVVKPTWVNGVARLRVPYLGWIRLTLTGVASVGPVLPLGVGAVGGGAAYAIGRAQ